MGFMEILQYQTFDWSQASDKAYEISSLTFYPVKAETSR